MSATKSHVLSVFMNRDYPSIVRAEGIYLYDDQGKRYIDSAGAPYSVIILIKPPALLARS